MNTPAHAVLNLFALERGDRGRLGAWIVAGAVAPDVPGGLFYAYQHFVLGRESEVIYPAVYRLAEWQLVLAPSHSVLVVALVLLAARWRRHDGWSAFGWSALLHLAADALTHVGDAHPHLWPLTDWRMQSLVSYWDRSHYAAMFVPLELAAVLIASGLAWRRSEHRWRHVLLVACCSWLAIAYAFGWSFWGSS